MLLKELRCAAQVARNPLVVAGRALRVSRAHGHMPDWKVGPCWPLLSLGALLALHKRPL